MKNVLLITVFLVVAITTKLMAQDQQAIKINHLQEGSVTGQSLAQQENHQFEIVAKEDLDINLNFFLKKDDNVNIVVTDESNRVVFNKKIKKGGKNRLDFSMNQDEKYTVKLSGEKLSELLVKVSEN